MSSLRSHRPRTRFRPIGWLLMVMAMLILALAMNPDSSRCVCNSETADVIELCEQNDQVVLPVHTKGELNPTIELKLAWFVPPMEALSQPDLDVKHPPPWLD